MNESLLNSSKTADLVKLLEKIYKFEQEIKRVREETKISNLEKQTLSKNHNPVTNYQISHLELDEEEKKVFIDNFTKPKLIYEYIPYWYSPLLEYEVPYSETASKMMISSANENTGKYEISEDQLELILDHLDIENIGDFTLHLRKFRKEKEFGIFDKADLYYLNRGNNISMESLKKLANKVLILTKER